jgi:sporulation protein YlmC with PRC-barrel domain
MNVGDLLGREVLDLSTATTVGCVDDVVIDPATRRVTAFRLGKTATSRAWLPFGNVTAVDADVLTVTDDVQLLELPGDVACCVANSRTLGGRVLTDQGREIGPLRDIDIDNDGSTHHPHHRCGSDRSG